MNIADIAHCIPFFGVVAAAPTKPRPALTKLTEQGTVGLVAAVFVLNTTANQHAEELKELRRSVAEIRADMQYASQRIDATLARIEAPRELPPPRRPRPP